MDTEMIIDSSREARKKARKRNQWRLAFLVVLIAYILLYFVFVPTQPTIFPELQKPIQISHQGGENIAPSNTMAAFDLTHALNIPVMDLDLHITKDGQLVIIHDKTVDRTTNGKGRVDSYNLADLQKLDAGYNFKDPQGNYSYRGKGVYIPTLEELFAKYGREHYFNIEIKDDNAAKDIPSIEHQLWALIQKYHLEKKTIVTSFNQDIVDQFGEITHGQVALAAGRAEVTQFVIFNKLYLSGFYRPHVQVLEIPTENSGINLMDKHLIDQAHRLNMQVYYWTIDDKKTMRELLEMGADGILTSRPDLLKEVVAEMAKEKK